MTRVDRGDRLQNVVMISGFNAGEKVAAFDFLASVWVKKDGRRRRFPSEVDVCFSTRLVFAP